MKEALGYNEFLKFAVDFNLSSSQILSSLELGDIYLSSIRMSEGDGNVRKLTFLEFWEATVRCALVAYSKISEATIADKIMGLFLYMWRSVNKNVPRAIAERRNISTYAGDLIIGATEFNKKFIERWSNEGYRDYLSPDGVTKEEARDVLSRLLTKQPAGDDGLGDDELLGLEDKKDAAGDRGSMDRGQDRASLGGKSSGGAPPPPPPDMSGNETKLTDDELHELLKRRPSIAEMLHRNIGEGTA